MRIKVGETVKNAVISSKLSKGDIVERLGKSRTWLAKVLENEYMQLKYVLQLGEILNIDFHKTIPELTKFAPREFSNEKIEDYSDMDIIELKDKLIELQGKYVTLLEEHVRLLNKVNGIKID